MTKKTEEIHRKFGKRLGLYKKRSSISYAKMHYATNISENHIKNTVAGKVNIGLLHLETYAKLFGVKDHEMLDYDSPIPDRKTLQQNISKYFKSIGFKSANNFKKIGPAYMVEEFILGCDDFSEPLEAREIRDKVNAANSTDYRTNDVSRILNNLADEGIMIKIPTGNVKKPKYEKMYE